MILKDNIDIIKLTTYNKLKLNIMEEKRMFDFSVP